MIAPGKPGKTAGSHLGKVLCPQGATRAPGGGTHAFLQKGGRLKKAGVPVTAPEHGSRKRPDGMSIEWMTADVGNGTPGSTLPFIIEDQTPRAWRVQTSASAQGAPVNGIEHVVLG